MRFRNPDTERWVELHPRCSLVFLRLCAPFRGELKGPAVIPELRSFRSPRRPTARLGTRETARERTCRRERIRIPIQSFMPRLQSPARPLAGSFVPRSFGTQHRHTMLLGSWGHPLQLTRLHPSARISDSSDHRRLLSHEGGGGAHGVRSVAWRGVTVTSE